MAQTAKYISNEEFYLPALQDTIAGDEIKVYDKHALAGNKLFSEVVPLSYHGRLRVNFFVSEDYKQRFGLLRGLIEFHRPAGFLFTYDGTQKVVTVDIAIDLFDQLTQFLHSVAAWMLDEIEFKEKLKYAISFENEYKTLAAKVYGNLSATQMRNT
jgi:hypothetical protein